MDWVFLLLLGLVLFLVRDALLLSLLGARAIALKARAAYAVVLPAVFAGLGGAAELISREQAVTLLRDPRVWVPAVGIHVLFWVAFSKAKKASRWERPVWLLTLIPVPLFLVAAGGLCWMVLSQTRSVSGAIVGGCLGIAWVLLVFFGSWIVPARRTESAPKTLDFAAAANLSAILLLPMYQYSENRAVTETAWQTRTSALALIATAALIGASFLFHRLRRTP